MYRKYVSKFNCTSKTDVLKNNQEEVFKMFNNVSVSVANDICNKSILVDVNHPIIMKIRKNTKV